MQSIPDVINNLGTDFEFLIIKKNGEAYPATLAFAGFPKSKPFHEMVDRSATNDNVGYFLHDDGRQGESSTIKTTCRDYLLDSCWYGLKKAKTLIEAHNTELSILTRSSTPMTKDAIIAGGAACIESGCNPDIDGYTGLFNIPNYSYPDVLNAFAGVHLHYETTAYCNSYKHFKDYYDRGVDVQLADRLVTMPLMAMLPYDSSAKRRREFYGKAGCCRTKDYGREYRTLGGEVMCAPWCVSFAFGMIRVVIGMMTTMGIVEELFHIAPHSVVQDIINNNKREEARALSIEILRYLLKANHKARILSCQTFDYPNFNQNKAIIGILEKCIPIVEEGWEVNWNISQTSVYHGNHNKGWVNGVLHGKYKSEIKAAAEAVQG